MAGCDPAGRKQNWFGLVWFGLSWVPPLDTCRAYTLDPIVWLSQTTPAADKLLIAVIYLIVMRCVHAPRTCVVPATE